jgi:iron(III) transport system substrate-binding protein
MNVVKTFQSLLILVLTGLLLPACRPVPTPMVVTQEVEKQVVVTQEVKVEKIVEVTPEPIGGDLILYSCLFDPDKLQVLFDAFKAQYGVNVTCLAMGSGEALERIRSEKDDPQGDVLFGIANVAHVSLAAEGLTLPYQGSGWRLLPEGPLKDPQGRWVGLYYGVIGFACSPERLQAMGVACPDSWQDLLDPAYQGQIVIASPAASGTAYTVLSGLAQLMGEDGAFEFWRQMDANVAQYTESGSEPAKLAAAGEFAVGIAFTHDIQVQQDNGLQLEIGFPEEGTPYEIGGISIIQGTKHEEAAKAWVDYVFTEVFQRYHNDIAHRLPVVPSIMLSIGSVGLEDVTLIQGYDPSQWAARRNDLVERWQEEIGSKR